MPPSSATYWTSIRPDWRLRALVIASGTIFLLAGLALIAGLPVPGPARGAAIVLWTAWAARELRVHLRAYRRWSGYRIAADGDIGLLHGSREHRGRLLPGCVVLPGVAWLRLAGQGGPAWGELVRRDSRESEAWRRLQVIFRHRHTC